LLLRWLKKHNNQGLIGLDIGSDSIKLLQINAVSKPYQVEKFSMAALPVGAVVKGEMKDYPAIGTVLKELFKQANIQIKSVALAIPRSSVIIKNISVDSRLNSSEIESRAWIEANHSFPDLVGEIYLDFSVNASPANPSQLDLMLIACRKDQIKPYFEVLDAGGLAAKVIDVNSYALERALSLITKETPNLETVALLNLDANLSTFLVVHGNELIYAHDHSYDGQRLQSQSKEYLSTAVEKIASLNDAAYVEVLKNVLAAHLRHTMHFFYSSRPNINIQKIILAGDCAQTPCLTEYIQQEVGIETELADPFKNMVVTSGIDTTQLQQNAPMLMLACGLALSVDNSI
jgi:type IV pilus assembly protein PilM